MKNTHTYKTKTNLLTTFFDYIDYIDYIFSNGYN